MRSRWLQQVLIDIKTRKQVCQYIISFKEAELSDGVELPDEWKDALEQYQGLFKHSYLDFTTIMIEAIENLKTNEVFEEKVLGNLKYFSCG